MKERITWNTELVAKYMYETDKCKLLSEYWNPATMLEIECECGNIFKRCFRNYRRNNRIGVKNMCKTCKTKHLQNVFRYKDDELIEYLKKYSMCSLVKNNNDGTLVLKCECGTVFTVEFRKFQKAQNGTLRKCPNCVSKTVHDLRTISHKFNNLENYLANEGVKYLKIISGDSIKNAVVEMCCSECGNIYDAKVPTLKKGQKRLCSDCITEQRRRKYALDFSIIESRANDLDYILLTKKEEYKNENTKIYFYCKKHIEEGIMKSSWSTLRNTGGCMFCKCDKISEAKALNPEEYKKKFEEQCGHVLELLSEYVSSSTKIKVRDKRCGTILKMLPKCALNLEFYCPRCSKSKLENRVSLILEDMGKINYPQHSFDDCMNIFKLRFDFIVYKNEAEQEIEALIEVQGAQHKRPIGFGQKDENKMMEAFYLGLERDKIKKQYCEDNNIRLLELWYYDYKDFEKILRKELERIAT